MPKSKSAKKRARERAKKRQAESTSKAPARRGRADVWCCSVPSHTKAWTNLVTNPFQTPEVVAIPLPPALPSAGLTVFAKTTMTTGSGNVGFVAVAPKAAIANDQVAAWVTDATFADADVDLGARGVTGLFSNSPYGLDALGDDLLEHRLVSCGVRVMYRGTKLHEGGVVIALAEPDHQSLALKTESTLRAYDEARAEAGTMRWHRAVWVPARESDYHYTTATSQTPTIVIMVVGGDTTVRVPFDVEVYWHYQVVGPRARGKVMRSVDILGGNAAWDALATEAGKTKGAPTEKGVLRTMAEDLYEQNTHVFRDTASDMLRTGAAAAAAYATIRVQDHLRRATGLDPLEHGGEM
jgi:hypothetical protein